MDKIFSLVTTNQLDDELCQMFEYVYINSFPEVERRPFEKQLQLLREEKRFQIHIIRKGTEAIGFITTWSFEQFIYIEHFALHAEKRGSGAGSFAIRELVRKSDLPVILEVELPTEEMAIRRIAFYERAGFKIWSQFAYIQPPYELGGESLELLLMTAGDLDLATQGNRVVSVIHKEVYQADPAKYVKSIKK